MHYIYCPDSSFVVSTCVGGVHTALSAHAAASQSAREAGVDALVVLLNVGVDEHLGALRRALRGLGTRVTHEASEEGVETVVRAQIHLRAREREERARSVTCECKV